MNLQQAAIEAGIYPSLAWMWPLCIDSFIFMGSLFILQASIRNQPIWQGWLTVISFTAVSVAFNIIHSPIDWFSRAAHAVAPIALCGSLEMLMLQLKRDMMSVSDPGETPEPLPPVNPDKLQKVKDWFTVHPNSTINQARQALRMGPDTVKTCHEYLIVVGELQKPE